MFKIYTNGQKLFNFYIRGDSGVYNFSQVWAMVFYYDRISVKEGINLEAYEHRDENTL